MRGQSLLRASALLRADFASAKKNVALIINGGRAYETVIKGAKLVVELAIHFAATANVPRVGLWNAFSPESRAKYCPNH